MLCKQGTMTEEQFCTLMEGAFSPEANVSLFYYLEDAEAEAEELVWGKTVDRDSLLSVWKELEREEIVQNFYNSQPLQAFRVVEHRVNLDERGEFRASFIEHTLHGDMKWIADYTEIEQAEMALWGHKPDDLRAMLYHVTGRMFYDGEIVTSEWKAEKALCEIRQDFYHEAMQQLEYLTDVIRVEQPQERDCTFLVQFGDLPSELRLD